MSEYAAVYSLIFVNRLSKYADKEKLSTYIIEKFEQINK